MGNGMNFYFNDLYPNMGSVNTRAETIPEADDRKALAEDTKAVDNASVTPAKRKSIYIGLAVFVGIIVLLGVSK